MCFLKTLWGRAPGPKDQTPYSSVSGQGARVGVHFTVAAAAGAEMAEDKERVGSVCEEKVSNAGKPPAKATIDPKQDRYAELQQEVLVPRPVGNEDPQATFFSFAQRDMIWQEWCR